MRFRPKRPARENAARLLPRLAEKFFRAGDASVEDDLHGEEVHDFRIRTKRFRYVLEYFRPCYGKALDAYLEAVRGLQAVLGDLNDCHSTRVLLKDLLHTGDPPTRHKKILGALDRRENDLFEKYRAYWHETLDSREYREKFIRYLTHPPRRRPKKAAHDAKTEAAA
jgi:CHAD domain-containing protein